MSTSMPKLKRLHKEGIAAAVDKAERYRLLNEPSEAESICLDVLEVEPAHQRALTTLLLALTDQFDAAAAAAPAARAQALLPKLAGEYEREYYAGLISERRAKAALKLTAMRAASDAYEWLTEAMQHYERAEALAPPSNDEALLRYNACVRKLQSNSQLIPHDPDGHEPYLE